MKYFYGIEIPREMIAFSQPTACGIGLAESWFRVAGLGGAVVKGDNKKKEKEKEEGGWHVYVEGA